MTCVLYTFYLYMYIYIVHMHMHTHLFCKYVHTHIHSEPPPLLKGKFLFFPLLYRPEKWSPALRASVLSPALPPRPDQSRILTDVALFLWRPPPSPRDAHSRRISMCTTTKNNNNTSQRWCLLTFSYTYSNTHTHTQYNIHLAKVPIDSSPVITGQA